ncbi:methyltransferase domain-containing protein [Spirulina major CS-329]|uniref:class I SAM-dependent methyltransferase n=1 Tax=Spirulina TaxID=1154 RepID=UPI002330B1F2|nr:MULTISPECIES: methyltransferase domain-containing protein [Spirulina]MDB9494337.1 methyltransferase domain-containing protein [Spirulina subsalsa CS-330]MDB9502327.1 methyltransferase domain-containing protein [Spirulina major CS-329]
MKNKIDELAFRGEDREKSLSKSVYFSDSYFSLRQLFSLAQQIHEIHSMKPQSILEVGIGNGFVSTFFRQAGYTITTADINPSLEPDICAPLDEIHNFLGGQTFNLVVCCEVLEHMPLERLENNIKYLKSLGQKLFLTLPNYKRTFGLYGFLRLPKNSAYPLRMSFNVDLPKQIGSAHFWEVGSCHQSSRQEIINLLKEHYDYVDSGYMLMNPYHIYFKAS